MNFFKKLFSKNLYPELKKVGGLANALNLEFSKINSPLKVDVPNNSENFPFTYERVKHLNKFSQIYIAAEEKLYLPDFWRDGVCLAHAKTENISSLAKAIDFWLMQNVKTSELSEKYDFVKPSEKAKAFDEHREVEYTWGHMLQDEDRAYLHNFIKLAIHDPVVSKLFPFTSFYTLCFSTCTGYPYASDDLPNVSPKVFEKFAIGVNGNREGENDRSGEMQYVVTKNKNEYLGEGNAQEAIKIVKDNLPDNIQPAVKGTADS